MIHFKLYEIEQIHEYLSEIDPTLPVYHGWNSLTMGEYGILLGETALLKYTPEVISHWNEQQERLRKGNTGFDDYQIIFFLFPYFVDDIPEIGEPVPSDLYELVNTLEKVRMYEEKVDKWADENRGDEVEFDEEFVERNWCLTRLVSGRLFRPWYLAYKPSIYFFRVENKLNIFWDMSNVTDEGIAVWTAGVGMYSMQYADFVAGIEDFGRRFFGEMTERTRKAIQKDWGSVELDKTKLWNTQKLWEEDFIRYVRALKNPNTDTDWVRVRALIAELDKTES
ncbi:MAG: DUF5984 family protein [Polyangiaceae bacterium]|nr:DUF5984 family protein [Polyangiaceae bacterium]